MSEHTQPLLPLPENAAPAIEPATAPVTLPEVARPATRAQRMSHPIALHAIKAIAEAEGVCVRPLAMRRTDLATGETAVIDLPCGATRESKCGPCARRARRLRQVQCREGWHRPDEPLPAPEADEEQAAMLRLRADFE